jgi:tetratricopeptide (TPR) repeat protein
MRHFLIASLIVVLMTPIVAGAQNPEVKKYMNGAITLYENLEYEKALKQLQKARTKAAGPDDEMIISLLEGVVLGDMGKDEAALKRFKEGFSVDLKAKLPVEVSPKIAALAEKARASVEKLLAPQLEQEKAEEARRVAGAEAKRVAEQKRLEEEEAARNRPKAPPIVERKMEPTGPSLRTLSIIPAVVGLASAGVATYFLLGASSKQAALNNGTVPLSEAMQSVTDGKQQATLGYVFSGVAGAGIVAAATMFILGAPKENGPMVSAIPTAEGGFVALTFSQFDLQSSLKELR